jgi:Na+/H+-dicarboxylate symporter
LKISLHKLIFIGMGLGILFGLLLAAMDHQSAAYVNITWIFNLIGKTIFIGALKMLVAPLIFASIVAGITSLPSTRELGALGAKTFIYYFATTTIAVLIGLVAVNVIQPGRWDSSAKIRESREAYLAGIKEELEARDGEAVKELGARASFKEIGKEREELERSFQLRYLEEISGREDSTLTGKEDARARMEKIRERKKTPLAFIKDIFATMIQNPFKALTGGSSLGIIFFAILFGVACTAVGSRAGHVVEFFRGLNQVIMKLTVWVMTISPVAIMCLMASLVGQHGTSVFKTLAGYVITVLIGIGIHIGVLLTICRFAGGMSPARFLRGMQNALLIAFSTRSSAATLPVTMKSTQENLKVPKTVSEFVLPIGATVNMDGTALYEGVAVIFLIQMFGGLPDADITLGAVSMVLIFLTAVLASVGAAAVPDAGLITMVLVANAVGLPEYYLVFIFAVDAFLDQFRTSTNVMGDSIGTVVLARLEKKT